MKELLRKNIAQLKPYSCARDEFKGGNADTIFLDANESPYSIENPLNRYPDPLQWELKEEITRLKGVAAGNIFLGNGSDEAIDLIFRIFCNPGEDNVVAISPSYGMYSVCADINDIEYREVALRDEFTLNVDDIMDKLDDKTKVIFICSPNNPTGGTYRKEIEALLARKPHCIVVVDEAYADFCPDKSVRGLIPQEPLLMVLSTFSKAWASAGVRLGMAFASEEIIGVMNKVKYPYNVNLLTQRYALDLLRNHKQELDEWVDMTIKERERVMKEFARLPICQKVFPSEANFFLAKVDDANATYMSLAQAGIIVRNRNSVSQCEGCLRITIGTKEENDALITALRPLSIYTLHTTHYSLK